ncbi:MAG: VOC family protein [Gemmatimonadaceae bacterium]|nr:VOC family protein [Gemmatimonadaceae bacterium]
MGPASPDPQPPFVPHTIPVVVLSASRLAESAAFYARVFGWDVRAVSDEISVVLAPAGPTMVLRRYGPSGGPAAIPFIQVDEAGQALARVVAAGATVDRLPYEVPMAGRITRFADPSGTVYGLTSANPPGANPPVPMPMGANPRPMAGTVCHVELYSRDLSATAHFFHEQFGWEVTPTTPQYTAFNPNVGISGIWQSHTPVPSALPYIYVADVNATLAAIDAANGRHHGHAVAVPGMATFGYFTDPSGTAMGLMGG